MTSSSDVQPDEHRPLTVQLREAADDVLAISTRIADTLVHERRHRANAVGTGPSAAGAAQSSHSVDLIDLAKLLVAAERRLSAAAKAAEQYAHRQQVINRLTDECVKRDNNLRSLTVALAGAEEALAGWLFEANDRLKSTRQANARPVQVDQLINAMFSKQIVSAIPPKFGTHNHTPQLGDPARPYPTEAEMRLGELANAAASVAPAPPPSQAPATSAVAAPAPLVSNATMQPPMGGQLQSGAPPGAGIHFAHPSSAVAPGAGLVPAQFAPGQTPPVTPHAPMPGAGIMPAGAVSSPAGGATASPVGPVSSPWPVSGRMPGMAGGSPHNVFPQQQVGPPPPYPGAGIVPIGILPVRQQHAITSLRQTPPMTMGSNVSSPAFGGEHAHYAPAAAASSYVDDGMGAGGRTPPMRLKPVKTKGTGRLSSESSSSSSSDSEHK